MPPDARGTYVIPIDQFPATSLVDQDGQFIPLVGLIPARITIATGKCCYDLDVDRECTDNVIAEECDALPGPRVFRPGDFCSNGSDPCCSPAAAPAVSECCPDDGDGASVRYLSFTAGRPFVEQAIRVTFDDLPAPFATWNNTRMWVGPPVEYCENSGQTTTPDGCAHVPGIPSSTFMASTLRCQPYYTDWSVFGTLHVFHEGIIPSGTYELETIDILCDSSAAEGFSVPLTLRTSRWGDLVKDCTTQPCGPPDGRVDVTTDVIAFLEQYANTGAGVTQIKADLLSATGTPVPDQRTDVLELIAVLDAFGGFTYPFLPGPLPCTK